jgi:fructose-1,6-bisphosphatase I
MSAMTLDEFLRSHATGDVARYARLAELVRQFALAAVTVRATINQGAVANFTSELATRNMGGDAQHQLDIYADEVFLGAAQSAGAALYCSEELDTAVAVRPGSDVAVAIDPLDGSSNIATNVSIGTIFSILPVVGDAGDDPLATFLQPGRNQLASGFFIYGPHLALALTLGAGTHIFVYLERTGAFVAASADCAISPRTQEFAVNASNYRHWDEAVRLYIDDCLNGETGPRDAEFNMRWVASLVAEAYRILVRGGVFLYPRDNRKGYGEGRLRLVYEANPIALLTEQAGGAATDGVSAILDLTPTSLHQRTPLVFGSAHEVTRIARYHTEPSHISERAPLFGYRGLFRV